MSSLDEFGSNVFGNATAVFVSLGSGGWFESSSTAGAAGLDTAEPPPSTPLLTDGVFSESLHSSSSPVSKKNIHIK